MPQQTEVPGVGDDAAMPRSSGRYELRVARSVAGHEDDHGLVAGLGEVGLARGFGVDAAGRQILQLLRIELLAVSHVPRAGDDRDGAIVPMSMRACLRM